MIRWWLEIKRCLLLYKKTKDVDHIKDMWRVTEYHLERWMYE